MATDCQCAACLDDLSIPPADYLDPWENAYEMAAEACWRDDYDPRSDLDIGDFL